MLQFSKFQTAAILGLILLGALFAAPNLLSEEARGNLPGFVPRGTINLGLDLQGGSYLLLGVDTDKVIDDRMKGIMTDLRREMRPVRATGRERISFDNLVYNDDSSVVTMRIAKEADINAAADRARDLTRGGALGLGQRNYVVSVNGSQISIAMTPDARRFFATEAVRDSIEVIRRRIDPAAIRKLRSNRRAKTGLSCKCPAMMTTEALKQLINRTGQLTFHAHDPSVNAQDAAAGLLPPRRILVPFNESEGAGQPPLVLNEDPIITGAMVQTASAAPNPDGAGFQINFSFDSSGARRFADHTRSNIGSVFAIVLDGEIISAPTIQSAITQGSGRITGNFSALEAAETSLLIRSGALPAELRTLEQRSVGAQLGADSVKAGTYALIIGFVAVIIYMVVSYGRFGVYADMALVANVILIAGMLSLLGSTLTLPGIAGIVLTIGMAVDANVLIFERIREELRNGKSPINAAELGYQKAWSAIADAKRHNISCRVDHVSTWRRAGSRFCNNLGGRRRDISVHCIYSYAPFCGRFPSGQKAKSTKIIGTAPCT